ncbi:hypothetical protein [Compostibacter hankyongensis]|uniref:DUF4185 domain-containing protein n=1 Tax=Compostibacter hankyongensis TaxID=1007089 RepID=A0ABP8FMC6_9BACT
MGKYRVKVVIPAIFLFWTTAGSAQQYTVYKDSSVIRFFRRTHGWIASDGALSVPLADGRTLWLMGDSHINDYDSATGTIPALFQVRNCALLQPAGDWQWEHTQTLIGHGPGIKSLFKERPDDHYFIWPVAGFQQGDTVYVYLANLKKTGKGAWDWGPAGRDLWGKMKFPEMDSVCAYTPLPDLGGIAFGMGFVKDKQSGYCYAYGSKLDAVGNSRVYAARFPMDNPNAPWTFWDGKSWSDSVDKIRPITQARTGVFMTHIRDKYVLISAELSVACDQGRRIFAATSDSPTGPFSTLKPIYAIDDTLQGHYPFFYTVIPHPEFINDKDELLITYCINGYQPCVETFKNGRGNPDYYRPKAIRVPLELIDPEL